jgi:hypothetical protein
MLLIGDSKVVVRVKGEWKIEDHFLLEKITESDQPSLVPIGLVTKDRIIALTSESLTLRSEAGHEHTKTRQK